MNSLMVYKDMASPIFIIHFEQWDFLKPSSEHFWYPHDELETPKSILVDDCRGLYKRKVKLASYVVVYKAQLTMFIFTLKNS